MAERKRVELVLAIILIPAIVIASEKTAQCVRKTCKCSWHLSIVKCRAVNLTKFDVGDLEEAGRLNVEVLDLRNNKIT